MRDVVDCEKTGSVVSENAVNSEVVEVATETLSPTKSPCSKYETEEINTGEN